MYKKPADRYSAKGRTFLLLEKRNKQFAAVFKKLRDPVSILQFYDGMTAIYAKFFDGQRKTAHTWMPVLLYLYDNGHLWLSDLTTLFGHSRFIATSILKRMGQRHLLTIDRSRHEYLYTLSPDGHLFLNNFTSQCTSLVLQVIHNGRTGKTKIRRPGKKVAKKA